MFALCPQVDADGLVYIDVSHNVNRPNEAKPIQTESSTIYADINSDTLRRQRDDGHGNVRISEQPTYMNRTANESPDAQSDGRTTDSDGLIYIDISHSNIRSRTNAEPIRTEEETIYADLQSDAIQGMSGYSSTRGEVGATSRLTDEQGVDQTTGRDLIYIDLSHDKIHPPRPCENPIRTEEQTIYADLNPEAMNLQKGGHKKTQTTDGARTKDKSASGIRGWMEIVLALLPAMGGLYINLQVI